MVFSMVFAISMRRQREKLVVADDGHRFGDVALVTTFTSIISTNGSGSFSPESDDGVVFSGDVVADVDDDDDVEDDADGDDAFVAVGAAAFAVSLTNELSSEDGFVSFSLLSLC